MRTDRIAAAALIVVTALALHVVNAQQSGSKRTDLQRHDLSAHGREVIQVRVDFDPGYVAPKHSAAAPATRGPSGARDRVSPRVQ